MKKLVILIFVFAMCMAHAQEKATPTEQLTVEGKVARQYVFSLKDAGSFKTIGIDSLVIYNHLHERKRTVKNIRGILLKDILDKAGFSEKNPKLLSEFYITCVASDGYKVVFSWNEIFNTEVGNHLIIATEADGLKGAAMPDRLQLVSAADISTGRRFVKGIAKMIVERVQ